MLSQEQKAIEYRAAHWYPVPARPDGKHAPSCDLARLMELMYHPTDMAHGEGLVSIVSKKCDGRMVTVSTLPASRLPEFVADSLYVISNQDYYITKASFRTAKNRRAENAYAYDFVAVEIDCHNSGLSSTKIKDRAGAIVDVLRMGPVADGNLPDPNLAIYSGRGVHLIWLADRMLSRDVEVVKAAANAYAGVVDQELSYFPCFADFQVDRGYCNNPSGLIRLPGTVNSANGAEVTYEVYHTDRIAIPINTSSKIPVDTIFSQVNVSSASRTGQARMRAIESLVELRGNLCTGARDIITLIYYCAAVMAGYPAATCESLALMLNASFSTPRPESEVISSLSSARDKRYKYTDSKIISLLDISNDELAAIGWHAITGKHAKRDAQRARARETKIAEVLQMHEEGKSISAISCITGRSRTTIRKWIANHTDEEPIAADASEESVSDCKADATDMNCACATTIATKTIVHIAKAGGHFWAQYMIMLIFHPDYGHDPPIL